MLWRELLASCFDHPLLTRELRHLAVDPRGRGPAGSDVRLSRAVLFVGWLMSRLRLSVRRAAAPRTGRDLERHAALAVGGT